MPPVRTKALEGQRTPYETIGRSVQAHFPFAAGRFSLEG
jgi:hypothetical protein